MTQFRSRGKGSKRKVYPVSGGSKKKVKRTVATKIAGYRINAKGERENIDYGWMSPTELQKELIYANQRGWIGEASLIRAELQKRSYERYKQETLQQQRKDRAETERVIKLLKMEYAEDIKDFRKGKYPNTTLNELRVDYLRELNQLQKRLKNPYPRLIPEDSDNYGP